jgi:hypothetical protein
MPYTNQLSTNLRPNVSLGHWLPVLWNLVLSASHERQSPNRHVNLHAGVKTSRRSGYWDLGFLVRFVPLVMTSSFNSSPNKHPGKVYVSFETSV